MDSESQFGSGRRAGQLSEDVRKARREPGTASEDEIDEADTHQCPLMFAMWPVLARKTPCLLRATNLLTNLELLPFFLADDAKTTTPRVRGQSESTFAAVDQPILNALLAMYRSKSSLLASIAVS